MALGAKLKLGFIDGSCVKPASDHDDLQRWIRCDYMVTCWILNSMVTELSDAFLYAQSACELWKEIRERYGQSNGPLVYQLERELSKISQVRSQILAMDHLSIVNKAYDIVHQIKKQKQVSNHVFEPTAFFSTMNNKNNSNGRRENNKGNRNEIKGETKNEISFKKVCTNYGQEGHLFEQCFERLGYPDWYKGKKAKKNNRLAAHVNSGFDEHFSGETPLTWDMRMRGKAISEDKRGASSPHAVTVPQKDKFNNRGIKCVLLGDLMNQKGYKLYNLQTQEVFNRRDTIFKEDVFPFKDYKKPKGSLFVHDFPSFGDEFYPETTQTPLPPDPVVVIPNNHISTEPDNENSAPIGTKSSPHYPLFALTYFLGIPQQHIAFLANVFAQPEPTRYQQAIQHPGWVESMNKELEALEKNNTWTLIELPSGHKAITSKWVYKTKFKPTSIIERLKARLVVREICMLPPEGYTNAKPGHVCKLNRSLYGLKQASRQWNQELTRFLVEKGYEQSKQDYSLFVKVQEDSFTAALVYVDDVSITCNTPTEIDSLKKSLDDKFTIKDLGLANYFLDAGLTAAKPNLSPLPTNLKLSLDKRVPISDPAAYRRLVGRLLYLTMIRPNISYAVQHLSHFVSSPKDVHLQAKTKKQATESMSSTEAEYRSMATTTCKLLWLSFLLIDLHIPVKLPITIFRDNKSAQQIAANPFFHERAKHMDIDSHFTRDKVQDGFLQTAFIPSHLQLADTMTKALNSVQHSFLDAKLGVSTAPT
uniref:Uncharacterized protein n=1 Tax=Tanacetum cinerariifolium TaxID=118510 RepID=A0A6L2N3F4_TANCI|nr:hypothetical protein [Tanacetum cinerariifolium]